MNGQLLSGTSIIVFGASAGGVEILKQVVSDLPADIPAAVFICLHTPANSAGVLPAILARHSKLPVRHPANDEEIISGTVYVAPPDTHMVIEGEHIHLTRGPRENGHRPAIDPLFRSAGRGYERRVIGVVVSGSLDDGTAGLSVISSLGGTTVVQDPEEALFPGMPRSAIDNVKVDYVCPSAKIAPLLHRLAWQLHGEAENRMDASSNGNEELGIASQLIDLAKHPTRDTPPSVYTCPDCHGSLWEVHEGTVTKYRCRTGHAYSTESLFAEQTQFLESALWTALRALQEKEDLARRLAERATSRGHRQAAEIFHEQLADVLLNEDIIRSVLKSTRRTFADNETDRSSVESLEDT